LLNFQSKINPLKAINTRKANQTACNSNPKESKRNSVGTNPINVAARRVFLSRAALPKPLKIPSNPNDNPLIGCEIITSQNIDSKTVITAMSLLKMLPKTTYPPK